MMHTQSILYALVALLVAGTANAFFVVSGVHAGVNNVTGERPFRQNIQTFKNSGPAWDLYLLSLQKFQLTKSTDPLSWYTIAGVHGRPFLPWDGVNGQNQAGYAMHTSILFGPWHRAYLALFEQIIWNNAQTIAASYPADQKAKYQAAAQTLRIPYWDWASSPALPSVVTNANIWVNTPTGGKTINNPLYSYKFSPLPTDAEFPSAYAISHYKNTVRMPNANGNSQPNQVNAQLLANGAAIRDRTYLLVASQSNYAPFSNQGYTGPLRGSSTDSLENIHNQIHGLTGGVGHMGYIPFSAFDPLFFLHHANVDRLDAIWSAIYPDSYVIPENDQGGTFTEAPNTMEDENTPLTPFHTDQNGNFHTAKTARYPRDFGYSYPEIVDWNVDASQVSANTRAAFKALYDPTSRLGAKARRMRRQAASTPAVATREWSINLKMNKNALGDSYFVHFFLGAPPTDAATWSTSNNLVFSQAVLSDLSSTPLTALAQVPLTRSLTAAQQSGKIADLKSNSVNPFLKENLQWRVQRMDGTVVDPATLTDLSIAVVDQEVTPSGNAQEFNTYGPFNAHPELTWGSQ